MPHLIAWEKDLAIETTELPKIRGGTYLKELFTWIHRRQCDNTTSTGFIIAQYTSDYRASTKHNAQREQYLDERKY
jgi:hypothetical protein